MPRTRSWILLTRDRAAGRLVVTSSYHEAFVADVKRLVPTHLRRWDPEAGAWYVHETCRDALRQLALGFAEAWEVEGRRRRNLHTGAVEEQLALFEED